jgi:hypothetical protein
MNSKLIKGLAVCAAGGAIAAGAVTAGADQTPLPPSELGPPVNEATPAVEQPQARRFAELRRPRVEDDEIPADLKSRLDEWGDGAKRWGANIDLARRAAPGVWLVPGDDFVCVAVLSTSDRSVVFSCATPQDVDEGLMQPASLNEDGAGILTGVMSDGVESVTLVDVDGSSREVQVERNIYRAAIDADIKEVRWVDSGGVERVRSMAWER